MKYLTREEIEGWFNDLKNDNWVMCDQITEKGITTSKLSKDGFRCIIIYNTEDSVIDENYGRYILLYGPDSLLITNPDKYNGVEDLHSRLCICTFCLNLFDRDKLAQFGFAQRVCIECASKTVAEHQFAGWSM